METEKTEHPEPIPVYMEDEHRFSGLLEEE